MVNKNFNPGPSHVFYFIRKGLYRAINRHAKVLNGVMLDFGCGSKPYKSLINVEKYIGLDFENPGHSHANEQIDVFYDGKNIPFENNYFDSILCSEVFEHLFDIEWTMKELNRVLKPGGKILVTCPFVWNEHEVPYDFARYTRFALNSLFEKSGFRIVTFEKEGGYAETIAQMKSLYLSSAFEKKFSRLSYPGSLMMRGLIWWTNSWGILKSRILPRRNDLYLTNVIVAEKVS